MNTMADVYKLFLLQEHGYFNFLSCHIKSVEHTSLFVKMGTQIAPGNNQYKANEVSVLYTATMKGGKWLLGKS